MRLHLPKGLLAALLAACFASTVPLAEGAKTITDGGTAAIDLTTNNEQLLFDASGSGGSITYNGSITVANTHWCGPSNSSLSSPQTSAASYYVNLAGVISGTGTLKFNEHSGASGKNTVWELSNIGNTYSGAIEVAHGQADNSYVQLTLSGSLEGSNVVTIENKTKTILHIANDISLGGLVSASGNTQGAVTAISGKTLTLNVSGTKTYYGSLGTGTYFTTDTYANTAPLNTDTSVAVNLTKTGTGTQNLNGTNKFGTLNVEQGTLGLGGTTTLTGTTTVSSGATLSNTGTLTNNGTLTISGIYTGKTIKQGSSGTISLASGAVVNLDQFDFNRVDLQSTDSNGRYGYHREYIIASAGNVTAVDGVVYKVNSTNDDSGTFDSTKRTYTASAWNYYYNIAGESATYSTITGSDQSAFDFIRVAGNGALVADANISHDLVSSGGSTESLAASGGFVKVDGTGITYSGAISLAQGSNLTITKADSRTDSADMTINGVISGAGGLIVSGDVTATLAAANTFTGGITIKSGSTLKLSGVETREFCGDGGNSVTVESGATFDLNGTHSQARLPEVTLNGGILTNGSSTNVGTDKRQLDSITLTANSEIKATSRFGLVRDQYADATISLGSYTLTKTGTGQFDAASTSVTGTGKIRIEAGAFNLFTQSGYTASSLRDGVAVELAGGELKGSFETKGKSDGTSTTVPVVTIHGEKDGTVSAAITNNGTLKVTSEAGKVVTFSGAITNGATGAILQIGDTTAEGTAKLTSTLNASTVGQIKVLNGSSLILYGNNANGDYAGTITVHEGGKMLATNNGNYNIVNGGNGKLVLNGEFTIESTGTNNVNGISGSGVVKTAQNATLNIVCEATGGTSTLDESDTTTPTSYTSNFNGSVEASGSAKTVSLVFTGPSDATDDSPGSSGTTVSLKSLSATNGSTLNVKGIAEATNTTGGLSVSELVIGTGSKVQAWGAGDAWAKSTEATVLMKGADGSPVTLTVGTAGQTGTSTLNANLVLDGATLTLNNALTMGSTLTLNDVTLSGDLLAGWTDRTQSLTLFSGVDALALGTGTASGEAITEENGVDASTYFKNLGQGEFLLTYTGAAGGGEVSLVNVPEPTTATLSLLALMGLAARRRRRKA